MRGVHYFILVAAACSFAGGCNGSQPGKVESVETRAEPKTDHERVVAKFVAETTNDPKSIEFLKWGPHLTLGELEEIAKSKGTDSKSKDEKGNEIEGYYRVVYRAKNLYGTMQVFDKIAVLNKGPTVGKVALNQGGDNWREPMMRVSQRVVSEGPAVIIAPPTPTP